MKYDLFYLITIHNILLYPKIVGISYTICQQSWDNKFWPTQWTQSLVIPIPKKDDIKKCSIYRTLSLICHSSNILLTIIRIRLTPQAEHIISEEQAVFRKGRSTVEQITNIRTLLKEGSCETDI